MLIDPLQQNLDQVYREDMMREAEDVRRARDLRSLNGNFGITAILLARVGKALSGWGNGLQARSGVQADGRVHQVDGDRGYVTMAKSH